MKPERLQKILARGGIASRRAAEQVIAEGRVRVNGVVVTELGVKADPLKDKVEVDGKRVVAEDAVYILLHKPRGVVATMSDPEGRPTVAQALVDVRSTSGKLVRVFPVGRLDFATSGAILATNDGAFSDALLHPREGVPKTYVVKVSGIMEEKDVEKWRTGIMLEDGVTLPAKVNMLRHEEGKTWFELTIREGRNQQIRRMGEASHFPVMRLARTSFAGVTTEKLPPGRWRLLTRDELMALKKDYGVPRKIPGNSPTVVASAARGTRGGRREQREVMPAPRGRDTHGRGPTGKRESAELAEAEMRVGRAAGEGLVRRSGPAAARNKTAEAGRKRPEAPRGGRSNREGRSRAPSPRANEEAGAAAEHTQGARFGGGSPGRRGYEVKKDWGGGAERGRTSDRGESAAPPPRAPGARSSGTGRGSSAGRWSDGPRPERDPGAAPGGAPRGDVGGGRFGRTRTTGTAGGIGAREDVGAGDRPKGRSGPPAGASRGKPAGGTRGSSGGASRGKPSGGGTRGSSNGGARGRR